MNRFDVGLNTSIDTIITSGHVLSSKFTLFYGGGREGREYRRVTLLIIHRGVHPMV